MASTTGTRNLPRRLLRLSSLIVGLVLFLSAFALPALAVLSKYGSVSCSYTAAIRSLSSSYTEHVVYEPYIYTTGYWHNGSSLKVRVSTADHPDIDWGVLVYYGGALNDSGTYGYCVPPVE